MDWGSIGRGAAIAIGGAALTFAASVVIPAMQDRGLVMGWIVAAVSAALAVISGSASSGQTKRNSNDGNRL